MPTFRVSFPRILIKVGKGLKSKWDSKFRRGVEHLPDNLPGYPMSFYDNLDSQTSPRVFKSLLPHQYLPEGVANGNTGKIVYFARDPRDVVVSLFHFLRIAEGYTGSLEECIEAFLDGNGKLRIDFTSKNNKRKENQIKKEDLKLTKFIFNVHLVERTPYWDHIRGFWNLSRDTINGPKEGNVLFILYEDLVKDLGCEIGKICTFLNKPNPSLRKMEELKNHLSFASMKTNPSVNREDWIASRKKFFFGNMAVQGKFMRKGKIGGWREEIGDENLAKRLNDWMKASGIQLWEAE